MDGAAILRVEGLHAGYGRMEVLRGVSLTVGEGEIVAVIGPNGAGKSTAFKSIVGLLPPSRGRIFLAGAEITGLSPAEILRRGLCYVPQGRIVFPRMTVRENLEMGAFVERDRRKVALALERVYDLFPILRDRSGEKAGTLSGGQQQMLAMGRALVGSPRVLLLDEPSLGLSPQVVDVVFDKILELRRAGLTLAVVEQNAARILEIADRGYVLDLGQNRFEGRGEELLADDEVRRLYLGGGR